MRLQQPAALECVQHRRSCGLNSVPVFRPVRGSVGADHPHSQQLPSWEGDPQHAGRASGPAVRRPGRRIQSRRLAPARLAASAQLQVGQLEEIETHTHTKKMSAKKMSIKND